MHGTSVGCLSLAAMAVVFGGIGASANATSLNLNLAADNELSVYISTSPTEQGTRLQLTKIGGGSGLVDVEKAPDGQDYQTNDWSATYSAEYDLTAGNAYYVHIVAKNHPLLGPSGLLAQLNLGAGQYTFDNGTRSLLSNADKLSEENISGWTVSTPIQDASYANAGNEYGWNVGAVPLGQASHFDGPRPLSLASDLYPGVATNDGGGPWGDHPAISNSAKWIWSNSAWGQGPMISSAADAAAPRYFQAVINYSAVPEAGTMLLGGCGIMPILAYRRRSKKA